MNFSKIWDFITEEKTYFLKMEKKSDVDIDFKSRIFFLKNEWRADSAYLILYLFRDILRDYPLSEDHEFTKISKILSDSSLKLPFSKKEYDIYIDSDQKNQRILYIIEDVLKAENYEFTVPSKESADNIFSSVSSFIEQILSDIFIYEGKKVRYYVDIYDRLTGFDVFLESGSIFIPVDKAKRSTIREDTLRRVPLDTIVEIHSLDVSSSSNNADGVIFVPSDYTDSLTNVCSFFNSFNIMSEDASFIIDTASSIKMLGGREKIITVDGKSIIDIISATIIKIYLTGSANSIQRIIGVMRNLSGFSNAEKDLLIESISIDIPEDIISFTSPYMNEGEWSHEQKASQLIVDGSIELCARNIKSNGDHSTIFIYNKRMNYFKEIAIDRAGIVNELIPDLGGFRYISTICEIDRNKPPRGYTTVDSYVTSLVTRVIHREFGTLPLYRGLRSSGIHMIDGIPIFSGEKSVHGTGDKNSINGVLVETGGIAVSIPKKRPTKRSVAISMNKIVEGLKGYITTDNNEYKYFSLLVMSTILNPMIKRSNKITISIVNADKYVTDGIKYKIFNGLFRYARIVNTDSDYVINKISDGNSSIIVTNMTPSIKSVLDNISMERFGEEKLRRIKNTDSIKTEVAMSSLVVFVEKEWIIDDSIIFNFTPKISGDPDARLYDFDDEAGDIASYLIANINKILKVEEDFIAKIKRNIQNEKIIDKSSYMDFFEKILPAMCLCQVTGYMDGMDFHNDMFDIFFSTNKIRKVHKMDRIILSMTDGGNKVEDKVFDISLRMNQYGDLVYVDKAFHKSYIDKEDTSVYVFIFDMTIMFARIKKDTKISYIEFTESLRNLDGYTNIQSSSKNWVVGSNKKLTFYGAYKDCFNSDKDNFCAIRIQKKDIISAQ